eukprot:7902403-Pyramimonas_sp.AAC.1
MFPLGCAERPASLARPQRCTSQHPAFIAIAPARVLQTKLRVGGWDDCSTSGVDNFKFGK